MKSKTNWYWKQNGTNQSVIISTHTIVFTCIEVSVINNVADIPRTEKPIFIDNADHDYGYRNMTTN